MKITFLKTFIGLVIALIASTITIQQTQASFSECETQGISGIDDWYVVEFTDRASCSATGWSITGDINGISEPIKLTGEVKFKRLAGGAITVRATNGSEWTKPNYLIISKGENYQDFKPEVTSFSFSRDCNTQGIDGINDWYVVELVDKINCSATGWSITGATNGISEPIKSSKEVKFKKLAGGNINVKATNGSEWTGDNYLVIPRGENWNPAIAPIDTNQAIEQSVYLTIDSLKAIGKQNVQTYYFDINGGEASAIVLEAAVKNTGGRTFNPLEPDPLNPGEISPEKPWQGYIQCGTLVSPVSSEFEGQVLPGNLSSGASSTAKVYIYKAEMLVTRVHGGEVLPCHILALSGYGNLQPNQFPAQQYDFDLYFNGSNNTIEVANLREAGGKRQSSLQNIETGKRADPSQPITIKKVPPAGYEDAVLTVFNDYANPFPDTNINALEGKASAELYRRAIIGGYPDGEFKGSKAVNRAEAAKFLLLARFQQVQDIGNSGQFWDVLDGQWYTKYVVTAANKGIIKGHPDGTFRPGNEVNTAEFLKMLTLTFDLQLNQSHTYSDVNQSDWFNQYAGTARKYNLFPERSSSRLEPDRKLTRKEVAVAIYQYLSQK